MIVDAHMHVARQDMWQPWVHEFFKKMNPKLYERPFDEAMSRENVLAMLDEAGVDKAWLLSESSQNVVGRVNNEFVSEFCAGSNRLIPFSSANPVADKDPVGLLEHAIRELGMAGLKLYPPYQGFYPNDAHIYPLYAKAQELGIPVVFHTGTSVFRNTRLKYSDPLHLDDVAVDFPDLTIIQAHGGRSMWYATSSFLVRRHANVYLDIAGLPPKNLLKYYPDLEKIAHKVLFGSDWPGVASVKENIESLKRLPISDEAKRKILGDNAIKILKL